MPNRKLVCAALLLLGLCYTIRGAEGPQAGLSVKAISAGYSHALALASDGTVWAWGWNDYCQLGDGTTTDRPAPVQVAGLTGAVAVAAGGTHSVALLGDGSVWAWGMNGDGTTTPGLRPVQMSGLSGVVAISVLGSYSLALKGDGTVWAWDNSMASSTPRQVSGLTGVVAISGGSSRGMALKGDGTVWAWGVNNFGEVGDGTTTYRSTPVLVSGLAGVAAIVAGGPCSLAVKGDGTVWEWGYGVATPVEVSGLTGAVAVAAGSLYNIAVKADGTVWAWDWWYGPFPPVQVSGLTGIAAVSVGGSFRLALQGDGSIWAWGSNGSGQLGDGTYALLRPWPAPVSGLSAITTVAAGGSHSLAVKIDGTVWAWGNNGSGRLGDGTQTNRSAPVQASGLSGVVAVAGGSEHSLALEGDGTVWEWGLHAGNRVSPQLTPAQVSGINEVVAIAAGNSHSLAVKGDGTVWAWGQNGSGQLGDGTTESRSTPALVSGLSGIWAVAGGSGWDSEHSLALKDDGTVWAWGDNRCGQLGDGTTTNRSTRVLVSGLSGVVAIAAASAQSLAVKNDGTVWEWGCVDGIAAYQTTPVQRSGATALAAAAGGCDYCGGHSLAMRRDGTVWAWGDNWYGELGDATRTGRTTPVQVAGLARVVGIAAGYDHSLAVKGDGTVWAWGLNDYGQLGVETPTSRTVPAQVIPPGSPDLAIALTHAADFTVGDQGLYNLTITNIGRTTTAGTVTVTDTLPSGLVYAFAAGSGWTCMAADETVTCTNSGPVEPGTSTTITLNVRVEPQAWPGVTNLATVANASDRNLSNNTIGDPTVVSPGR